MSYAEATSVASRDSHRYGAEIQPGWDILGFTNGGYVMTIAARAMGRETADRSIVSVTGHFLNPARPGPIEIAVEQIKKGREFSTLRAVVTDSERPLLTATGTFADGGREVSAASMIRGEPPALPPPEDCERAIPSTTGPFPPPFVSNVDIRVHPDDESAVLGEPTGEALFRGWFRLPDDEPTDALAIVLASDAFPPAVFNAGQSLAWTPTLDLTVHIRDPRPHDWLKCRFSTRYVSGGFLEEDGEIWDEDGNLVALSRQLALVPR